MNFFILQYCGGDVSQYSEDQTCLGRPDDPPRLSSRGDVLHDVHHLLPVREAPGLKLAVDHLALQGHLEGAPPADLSPHHRTRDLLLEEDLEVPGAGGVSSGAAVLYSNTQHLSRVARVSGPLYLTDWT